MRRNCPSRRGFSLVELAMVTAIIGILALIAMPRYTRSLERYRAEAAARRIALDVDLARQSAMHASTTRYMFLDSVTTSYFIPFVEHLDHRGPNYLVSLTAPPYQADLLLVTFTDTGASFLSFDGFGRPNCGATITVRVGAVQRQVKVDPTGGQAIVQ